MKRAEYYEKTKQNKTKQKQLIQSNIFQRLPRYKGHFFVLARQVTGRLGEASPNKEARRGTMGREKEGNKPFLSFHSPNRPPDFLGIPRREGGGGGVALRRGERDLLADPPKVTCPTLLFPVFCLISILEESKIQINFTFSCFLCLWSRWSFIHSYLDSGSSIASSTKFLPVKRHFSSQVTKKTFNMTLICLFFFS